MYEGSALKRLIETRWTGHFQATKAIHENYSQIIATLDTVQNDKYNRMKLDGDDIATCIGILSVITQKKCVFTLVYMDELLSALAPVDAILQKRETSYHRAMPVIEAVKVTIADYRKLGMFDRIMESVEQLISESADPTRPARSTRNRRRSTYLTDFVIEESIGERCDENDEIKSNFNEVIDVILAEFDARFAENNDILLALSNSPNMDLKDLKPLENLVLHYRRPMR